MNKLPSEISAILGAIDPDAYSNAAYDVTADITKFTRVQAIIMVGDLGSSATVNAKLQGMVGPAGTPVDIPGAAITPLTQAGTDSNKQALINLNSDTLAGTGYTHVKLVVTVGVAASDMGALLVGFAPRYAPASNFDAASVDEIVSV